MLKLLNVQPYSTHHPLETLSVLSERAGDLVVLDGVGRAYFRAQIDSTVAFDVAGALGLHRMQLLDAQGFLLFEQSFRVTCETSIRDEGGTYEHLLTVLHHTMENFIENQCCLFNGRVYHYFVWWLRDHVHTMKGMKYFFSELQSAIDLYRDSQRADGMIFDLLGGEKPHRGEFSQRFGYGDFIRVVENGRLHFLRIPVENDVEFLYLEGIYYTWKATGDDGWMASMLDSAIAACHYTVNSPYRWSEKYQLLKRGFTIDTWDFQADEDARQAGCDIMTVDLEKSQFGVMHGDCTGFAAGCLHLAEMLTYVGRADDAAGFVKLADEIKQRLDALAWNGRFYTHHVPEQEGLVRQLGVDLDSQISLSNAYALNRGVLTHEQCVAIIHEYQRIRNDLPFGSPGEWYMIYPPFEHGFETACTKWEYVNGGVSSIVAGELAHGAFEHGFESYGVDILQRLLALSEQNDDFLDCCLRGAQEKPKASAYKSINLSSLVNAPESIPSLVSKPETNTPTKETAFWGVPFISIDGCLGLGDVRARGRGNEEKVLQIISGALEPIDCANGSRHAMHIAVPMAPETKAASIYLLHTLTGNGLAGHVTLEYADGEVATQYIQEGTEILNWWLPDEPDYRDQPKGKLHIAWEGKNRYCDRAAMSLYAMSNPRPEAVIARIVFHAALNGNFWAVSGLTLGDQPYVPQSIKSTHSIPENWGAAAVTYALIEGLAGVVDDDRMFEQLKFSPRWPIAAVEKCEVAIKYPASNGYVAYAYAFSDQTGEVSYRVTGSGNRMHCRLLLPPGWSSVSGVQVNNRNVQYTIDRIEESLYCVFDLQLDGVETISMQCQK